MRDIESGTEENIDYNNLIINMDLHEIENSDLEGNIRNIKKKRLRTKKERMQNNKFKHPIRPRDCKCKNKTCSAQFNDEERRKIYDGFWEMDKMEQRIWLSGLVTEVSSKRKVEGSRRTYTRLYSFCKDESRIAVCQKYFLSTLGYSSSTVIDVVLKSCKDEHGNKRLIPLGDQRGKHEPSNKLNLSPIKRHINSFSPKPSHYRRNHAPNRKYLPSDLTIKEMNKDFLEKFTDMKISYEVYRRTLDGMNIAFYDVQADKCGYCIEMDMNPSEENLNLKEEHLQQVMKTRKKYREDGESSNGQTKVFSADLQKVFLLPRMPKIKETFFTSRLIVLNETFASTGKNGDHFCIIWHEAIAGKRAEDISCAFLKFLDLNRDAKNIIIWLDNCGGQNKNNVFFSAILTYMNSPFCCIESVTINYLVTGHTYMSADGLHGKIEQAVRKMGNVEDFGDFEKCCKNASKRSIVVRMEITDFMKLENKFKTSRRKNKSGDILENAMPYFKDIVSVKFDKGSTSFLYKSDFDQESYITVPTVLKKKETLYFPDRLQMYRGISKAKKDTIMKDLIPKMQDNRRPFWVNLPQNDNSIDLLEGGI